MREIGGDKAAEELVEAQKNDPPSHYVSKGMTRMAI
jgi:hypothetical protein